MRKLKIVPPIENRNVPLMRPAGLAHRHLISLLELTSAEIEYILDLAQDVKATPEVYQNALEGRTLAMIF